MLKKAGMLLLWAVILLALGLIIWGLALYQDWPFWSVPLLFIGVILSVLLLRWLSHQVHALRLRLRMQRELPQNRREQAPEVDSAWNAGIRLLQQSRLGRLGAPLYVLPWFMMLGERGAGKSTLLTRSGLLSSLRPVNQRGQVAPTETLDWWFLEHSVVLDPSGRLIEGAGDSGYEWKRLLYWLLRSRRREPLNGLLLVLDSDQLLKESDERLADQGQRMRVRLDELVKVFGARLPVYLIITGAEALPGFLEWGEQLTEEQREQPFGLFSTQREDGAAVFLDEIFSGLRERLFELRIELGLRGLPSETSFSLPERIGELRQRLEKVLLPAFDVSPYSESPLLCGLFLTAEAQGQNSQREGWFARDLLGQLLPAQRYAYQPVDNWRHWRRLLVHVAVIAWLGLCAGTAALMIYAYPHTGMALAEARQEQPPTVDFSGGMDTDLAGLERFRQAMHNYTIKYQTGVNRLLPFSHRIEEVQAHYREDFVQLFNSEVRQPVFDLIMSRNLRTALEAGDPRVIAAFTEFVVRSINLFDAKLNHQPLASLPLPGNGMNQLYQAFAPADANAVSSAQMATIGTSIRAYLQWQTDEAVLQNQRSGLLVLLDSLGLENLPLTWLTALADLHGNLPPIRLTDYWADIDVPDVTLAGAYTIAGRTEILGFIDELGRASRDQSVWKSQRERFLTQYDSDTQDSWYQFLQRFLLASHSHLDSRADWQETLSVVGTDNDPYLKVLKLTAERFALIPVAARNNWARRAVDMDRLLKLANKNDLRAGTGSLKVANALGGDLLKGVTSGTSVSAARQQVNSDLVQAKTLEQFQNTISDVVADLQKSDAQAFKVAQDTWGFGSDPSVKSAPLWTANDLRSSLIKNMGTQDPRDDVVMSLVTGSLGFSLSYASEVAACQLQSDWNSQILSAIQGVQDPVLINELLYGDKGQLTAFLKGSVMTFVQRGTNSFSAREALGAKLPLNGAFFAYISRMQYAQNDLASAQRQSQAQQAKLKQTQQQLETEQKILQGKQTELQQNIAKLQTTSSVVTLSATPTQVNVGARQLPNMTSLTLQCNSGATVLDNYNFPSSTSFAWGPGLCSNVLLEISFANYKLSKTWMGDQAFVNFLQLFNGGQHSFTPDDFPSQRDLMGSDNLTSLQLTYRQQGEHTLLANYAAAAKLQAEFNANEASLIAIADQLTAMASQAAAQSVELATDGSKMQRSLAGITPPTQIAWCWEPIPADSKVTAAQGKLAVIVGIFDKAARIKRLELQLNTMGYNTQTQSVRAANGSAYQKLYVTGLSSQAVAEQAVNEIGRKLNITASLATAPPTQVDVQ
jgi:type VI secretion system protein ImpL